MKRGLAIGMASGLFLILLGGREWMIHQEVNSTRDLTLTQIQEQISSARDWSKLEYLTSSSTVFERFFEPVLLTANKLLWPPSREEILLSWRRELNRLVPELSERRHDQLLAEANQAVETLKAEESASMSRLLKTLEQKAALLSGNQVQDLVRTEAKAIGEAAYDQDQKMLVSIKTEGRKLFGSLKSKLKKLDNRGLAQYLASGNFHREFQEPILQMVLSLKQESLRQRTWAEFQKSLLDTLGQRKALLAKAQNKRSMEAKIKEDEQKFLNLFNSVAEAVKKEESEETPAVVPQAPRESTPSLDNPAELDYQQ